MDRFERLNRWHEKEDLIDAIKEIRPIEPANIRLILDLLAHPDVIQHTIRYFQELDTAQKCLNYEHPWNCAREAEARYQTIQYGWISGAGALGYDDSWCEPCRDRLLNIT